LDSPVRHSREDREIKILIKRIIVVLHGTPFGNYSITQRALISIHEKIYSPTPPSPLPPPPPAATRVFNKIFVVLYTLHTL
jgi:hypothetical protein